MKKHAGTMAAEGFFLLIDPISLSMTLPKWGVKKSSGLG